MKVADFDYEQRLIKALIAFPGQREKILQQLHSEYFFKLEYRYLFNFIKKYSTISSSFTIIKKAVQDKADEEKFEGLTDKLFKDIMMAPNDTNSFVEDLIYELKLVHAYRLMKDFPEIAIQKEKELAPTEHLQFLLDYLQKVKNLTENDSKNLLYEIMELSDRLMTEPVYDIESIITIEDNVIGTRQNLVSIFGVAKSGKSALVASLSAGSIIPSGDFCDTMGLTIAPNIDNKAVIHFDTEQSDNDVKKLREAIKRRLNTNKLPEHFKLYPLKSIEKKHYKEITTKILKKLNRVHNGIFMVIIDGIADYINDSNSIAETAEIVHFLEMEAIKYDCVIVTVLHYNSGNTLKGRGHLGSELERKSESVLGIIRNENNSTIEPRYLRNAGNCPKIQISWNNDKAYLAFNKFVYPTTTEQKQSAKVEMKIKELQILADGVFNSNPERPEGRRADFIRKLVELNDNLKERNATKKFDEMFQLKIIEKRANDYYYKIDISANDNFGDDFENSF